MGRDLQWFFEKRQLEEGNNRMYLLEWIKWKIGIILNSVKEVGGRDVYVK